MAALKTLGDWLDNSGWTAALEQANIATSGKADSFLKAMYAELVMLTKFLHVRSMS